MKKEVIIAVSNRGKQNEETVEQEYDIPESLEEAVALEGGEEGVFKLYLASYKVGLQNKIRKPPAKKVSLVIDSFKRMLPLVESNTITLDQAREASQYYGVWPLPEEELSDEETV